VAARGRAQPGVAGLSAEARAAKRARGAFYTPAPLVAFLVEVAAALGDAPRRVLDPACGDGRVLAACREKWPSAELVGWDLDPGAVEATRARGIPAEQRDGLLEGEGVFDLVIGNPPFLGQLQGNTVMAPGRSEALRARFPGVLGAYTDPAAMFLWRAAELAPAGVVALVQPLSTLAARDGRAIREALGPRMRGLWIAGAPVFEHTNVAVCVVGLGPGDAPLRRWVGPGFTPLADAAAAPSADTWTPLLPEGFGLPSFTEQSAGTLGNVATATADFRDEYYALAATVREAQPGDLPLVVSGHIDPGVCRWGSTSVRLGKQAWRSPAVPPDTVLPGRLAGWIPRRRVPKVLLATQSRVLEAFADADGRYLPVTPVVTVQPADPRDLWRILAVLLSPLATAWALREYGGTGMSGGAVKLSAKQVCLLPLPRHTAPWDHAAARLQAGDRDIHAAMDEAYGVELSGWYAGRC